VPPPGAAVCDIDWRDIMVATTPVRKSAEETGDPPRGLSAKRRLLLLSPFLVAGIYALFVVAWVAPPSPVKERLQPVLNAAFKPYFQQTWTLFSPNPPTTVQEGWYQLRFQDGGTRRETEIYSLTDLYKGSSRTQPLAPSFSGRVEESLLRSIVSVNPKRVKTPDDKPDGFLLAEEDQQPVSDTDAAAQWQLDLLEARHMLSRLADSTAASGKPVAVRLLVTGQFVPQPGGAPAKRNLLVDTGWLPYLPGGAR
jgi:hypothetical protein